MIGFSETTSLAIIVVMKPTKMIPITKIEVLVDAEGLSSDKLFHLDHIIIKNINAAMTPLLPVPIMATTAMGKNIINKIRYNLLDDILYAKKRSKQDKGRIVFVN